MFTTGHPKNANIFDIFLFKPVHAVNVADHKVNVYSSKRLYTHSAAVRTSYINLFVITVNINFNRIRYTDATYEIRIQSRELISTDYYFTMGKLFD